MGTRASDRRVARPAAVPGAGRARRRPAAAPAAPVGISAEEGKRLITRFLIGAVIATFVIFIAGSVVHRLKDLLTAIVAALFLSFALEPAVNFLARHRWTRVGASLAVLFGAMVIVGVFIGSMVPLLVDQIRNLVHQVPIWIEKLSVYTQQWFHVDLSTQWMSHELSKFDTKLAGIATDLASNAFGMGVQLAKFIFLGVTVLLFTYYLLAEAPQLRRALCSFMPPERQQRVLWTWETAIDKTGGYLYLRVIMAAISATCMFLGLLLLGVPNAVPLALWMGIFSAFIPTIGVWIGGAVPAFVALMHDPWTALILVVYIFVYMMLQDYVLGPKLTSKTMEINGGIAFGAVIAGASLFGIIGAFLALPMLAILQAVVYTYIRRHDVMESHLTSAEPWDKGGGRPGGRRKFRAQLGELAKRMRRPDSAGAEPAAPAVAPIVAPAAAGVGPAAAPAVSPAAAPDASRHARRRPRPS